MKIAIVKLSALGDIVHAMIVIQFIKMQDQKIQIDWVVEERFAGLLDNHPDIKNIHKVNIQKSKNQKSIFLFFYELRSIRKFGPYDIVIDMQGLIKSALVSRLIPSPITIGFDRFSIRENMASFFYNKKFQCDYCENVIKRNIALISFALDSKVSSQATMQKLPFLYSSQKHLNVILSHLKKNIVLIPGASYQAKRYPMEKFIDLTKNLDANFIIIWGNKNEEVIANEIKNQAANINVNVSEALSLDALISLINKVDLVIGPDTGPTHIAWALNVPSITLFGPTPGLRNTYITKINKVIESDSKVNPRKINKNDYSIKNISVDEVVKMSESLLYKNK